MDIFALIGIIIGFAGLAIGYLVESNFNFASFAGLIQPTAASIVIGGTLGAVVLAFPVFDLKYIPNSISFMMRLKVINEIEIIKEISYFADKVRKDGLLSLEREAEKIENSFLKKGIEMIIDGVRPQDIKDILKRDITLRMNGYYAGAKIFDAAGGYSPTMGVLGTVMGMVNILGKMGSDTVELGRNIAVAFVATLYGVMFANILFFPIAARIRAKIEREIVCDELIIEGLLSIQAGESALIIKEKLNLELMEKLNQNEKQ